jgi:hypothetical protein
MCSHKNRGGKTLAAQSPYRRFPMTNRRMLFTAAMVTTTAIGGAAACAEQEAPLAAEHAHVSDIKAENNPTVSRWIADLRQLTVQLHDFDQRFEAGYDTPLLDCMVNPNGPGAQAFHFGNIGRIMDVEIDPLAPEIIMYEPQKNGTMKLTGVEFIIPFDLLPFTPETEANPPSIHGIDFMPNHTLGLWALHVWNWRQNPDGMFAAWNPKVSCEYQDRVSF